MKLDLEGFFEFASQPPDVGDQIDIGTRYLRHGGAWFDPTFDGVGRWRQLSVNTPTMTENCSYRGLPGYRDNSPCICHVYVTEHDLAVSYVGWHTRSEGFVSKGGALSVLQWLNSYCGCEKDFAPFRLDTSTGLWEIDGPQEAQDRINRHPEGTPRAKQAIYEMLTSSGYLDETFRPDAFMLMCDEERTTSPFRKMEARVLYPRSAQRIAEVRARLTFDRLHDFQRTNGLDLLRVGLPDVVVSFGRRIEPPDPTGQQWAEREADGPWLMHFVDGSTRTFPTEDALVRCMWTKDLQHLRGERSSQDLEHTVMSVLTDFGWADRPTDQAVKLILASIGNSEPDAFSHIDFVNQTVLI